jgi:hypothetical protein
MTTRFGPPVSGYSPPEQGFPKENRMIATDNLSYVEPTRVYRVRAWRPGSDFIGPGEEAGLFTTRGGAERLAQALGAQYQAAQVEEVPAVHAHGGDRDEHYILRSPEPINADGIVAVADDAPCRVSVLTLWEVRAKGGERWGPEFSHGYYPNRQQAAQLADVLRSGGKTAELQRVPVLRCRGERGYVDWLLETGSPVRV